MQTKIKTYLKKKRLSVRLMLTCLEGLYVDVRLGVFHHSENEMTEQPENSQCSMKHSKK